MHPVGKDEERDVEDVAETLLKSEVNRVTLDILAYELGLHVEEVVSALDSNVECLVGTIAPLEGVDLDAGLDTIRPTIIETGFGFHVVLLSHILYPESTLEVKKRGKIMSLIL